MSRTIHLTPIAVGLWLICHGMALGGGLLDGRVFNGMIGPAENPDLADSLHFDNGHFWSDICTRCGFVPGEYEAEETDGGIVFRGTLESESRGRFDYEGLAKADGTMRVAIRWERRRWYWTSRREIAFEGTDSDQATQQTLERIRAEMGDMDPSSNPLCARF